MRRREFITLLGGAAVAWPFAAGAQQPERMRRVGVLMGYPEAQSEFASFVQELQKLGWADGRNLQIDSRWGIPGDPESMHRFAKELVALQPDLILSQSTPTTAALLQETRAIPIIFAIVADPIGSGFVTSFPRPGGNATGFVVTEGSLGGKWLELLKEIAPRVTRIAALFNPAMAPYAEYWLSPFEAAAPSFAVEAIRAPIQDTSELESVILHRLANRIVAFSSCRTLLRSLIALRSYRWRCVTVSLPFMHSVFSPNSAAYCPTEMT
jgi:putative tryptophan/tyrosine transport system substrate-binding protein